MRRDVISNHLPQKTRELVALFPYLPQFNIIDHSSIQNRLGSAQIALTVSDEARIIVFIH